MRSGWRGAALSQGRRGALGPWFRHGLGPGVRRTLGLQSAAGGTAAAGRTRTRTRTGQRSGVAGGGSRLGLDSGSWYKSSERLFPRRAARHNMEIDLAGFVWAAAGARWRAAPMRRDWHSRAAAFRAPGNNNCLPPRSASRTPGQRLTLLRRQSTQSSPCLRFAPALTRCSGHYIYALLGPQLPRPAQRERTVTDVPCGLSLQASPTLPSPPRPVYHSSRAPSLCPQPLA